MAVSTLFVTTASTETLNGTILDLTYKLVLGGETEVTTQIVPFSNKKTSLHTFITRTKWKPPHARMSGPPPRAPPGPRLRRWRRRARGWAAPETKTIENRGSRIPYLNT